MRVYTSHNVIIILLPTYIIFADGENAAAHTRTTTAANSALGFGRDVALSPRDRSLLLRPPRNADAAIVRTAATGTQRRENQQPPPPPIFGREGGGVRALVFWKGEKGYPTADDDDANTREDAPPTGPVRGGTDGAGDRRRGGVCVGRATAAAEESRLASIAAETPPRTRRTQSCGSNRTTRARSPHTHTERYVHTSRTHGPAEKLERCNTRDVTVHTHTNTHWRARARSSPTRKSIDRLWSIGATGPARISGRHAFTRQSRVVYKRRAPTVFDNYWSSRFRGGSFLVFRVRTEVIRITFVSTTPYYLIFRRRFFFLDFVPDNSTRAETKNRNNRSAIVS